MKRKANKAKGTLARCTTYVLRTYSFVDMTNLRGPLSYRAVLGNRQMNLPRNLQLKMGKKVQQSTSACSSLAFVVTLFILFFMLLTITEERKKHISTICTVLLYRRNERVLYRIQNRITIGPNMCNPLAVCFNSADKHTGRLSCPLAAPEVNNGAIK